LPGCRPPRPPRAAVRRCNLDRSWSCSQSPPRIAWRLPASAGPPMRSAARRLARTGACTPAPSGSRAAAAADRAGTPPAAPAVAQKESHLKRMLINAIDPEESRIAVVEDGVLQELHVELANREAYLGNVYKGKVVNIEPSIGAAFVSFGGRVNGFLHVSDVLPAYGRPEFQLDDVIEGRARVNVDDGPESLQH